MRYDFISLSSLSKSEKDALIVRYRKFFSLVYGKTIADGILDTFNTNNKFIASFSENNYRASLALDEENNKLTDSTRILLVYDDNNELSMAGRIIHKEKFIKLCEVVLFKKDMKLNSKLYKYVLAFLNNMADNEGIVNVEVLADNKILEYISFDNDFNYVENLNNFKNKTGTYVLEKKVSKT